MREPLSSPEEPIHAAAERAARACRALRVPAAFVYARDHTVICNDAYGERFGVARGDGASRVLAEALWSGEWPEMQSLLAATEEVGFLLWNGETRERAVVLRGSIWLLAIAVGDRSAGVLCAWLPNETSARPCGPESDGPSAVAEIGDPLASLTSALAAPTLLESRRGERVSVGKLLRDAIVLERALLEERRQRVSIAMDEPSLVVEVDRQAVAHAIANLLADAALFTPIEGDVEMFALRSGDASVDLGVRESGLGLLPDELRNDPSNARSRLTKGWSIEREIAIAHGGALGVASDGPDRGATVYLRLPIRDAIAAPVRQRVFRAAPRRRPQRDRSAPMR